MGAANGMSHRGREHLPVPERLNAHSTDLHDTGEAMRAIGGNVNLALQRLEILMQDRTTARRVLWGGAAVAASLATTAACAYIWHAIVGGTKVIIGG